MADRPSAGGDGSRDRRRWPVPADLAAVAALVVAADFVAFAPVLRTSPLRVAFGLPLALFLPGYALVSAVFPATGAGAEPGSGSVDDTERALDGVERVALSVALSVAVVGLVGLGLALTPLGIGRPGVVLLVSAITLGGAAVAARQRRHLPAHRRFRVAPRSWLTAARESAFGQDGRRSLAVTALFVGSVVVALCAVAYAVAAPYQGETYTEFYLLTENGTDEYSAGSYPVEFDLGEARPVVVGIENHEREPNRYTVVVQLRGAVGDPNATGGGDVRELDRFGVEVDAGERLLRNRSLRPTATGDRLRVVYLLYRGSPPADPSVSNAYRSTALTVSVTP